MQIHLIHPGQPVADFSISGTVVTVGGYEIDCAERQQNVAVIVEIRRLDGVVYEGDQGAYLAQIQIPARSYSVTFVESEPGNIDSSEPGLQGATETRQAQPLDTNAVVVTLWPTV